MKLYVIRHATAEGAGQGSAGDLVRKLTFRGRKEAERAGRYLKEQGARPEVIVSSPAKRAEETARLVAAAYGGEVSVETVAGLRPGSAPDALLEVITSLKDHAEAALVGHNPDLPIFCAALLAGPSGETIHFEPSSIWCLELDFQGRIPKTKLLWRRHPADMMDDE